MQADCYSTSFIVYKHSQPIVLLHYTFCYALASSTGLMDSRNCESVDWFIPPPRSTEHCMPITSEKAEKELFCVVQNTHLTRLNTGIFSITYT